MICLAIQKPSNPITSYRHFQCNINNTLIVPGKRRLIVRSFGYTVASQSQSLLLSYRSPELGVVRSPMAKRGTEAVMLTSGASGRINALLSLRAWRSLWLLINAVVLVLLLPFRGRRRSVAVVTESTGEKSGGKFVRAAVPRKSVVAPDVAVRRGLAIKRVVEDRGGEDNTVRDFSLFATSRGDTIFTQSWTPVKGQVRGLVVLLHGLNEHSGRYSDFALKLNANGFKVYGMDWIGHGGSDGLHAYVHSLDDAVNDMKLFLSKVLAENPAVPCFCFGHSTGGSIVLKAALDPKVRQRIAGVVLTSPAVGVQPSHPIFAVLAPVFSFLLPRYQFSAANKQGIAVSRDPAALVAKYSDPLVFTGSIRVRTGYEILRISTYLQQHLSKLTVPFLVLHGTADSVTDPQASRKLHEEASSTDKTIKLYEGLLHDLLFEPEKEEVAECIISWLNSRL